MHCRAGKRPDRKYEKGDRKSDAYEPNASTRVGVHNDRAGSGKTECKRANKFRDGGFKVHVINRGWG